MRQNRERGSVAALVPPADCQNLTRCSYNFDKDHDSAASTPLTRMAGRPLPGLSSADELLFAVGTGGEWSIVKR
jgi:hypothetical protein